MVNSEPTVASFDGEKFLVIGLQIPPKNTTNPLCLDESSRRPSTVERAGGGDPGVARRQHPRWRFSLVASTQVALLWRGLVQTGHRVGAGH